MKRKIEAGKIVFTFEGYESIVFDSNKASLPNISYATMHGFNQRIGDSAASSKTEGERRDAVQQKMKQAGIPTAVHYPIPLNKQPAVADETVILPRGDEAAEQVLSLPMHPYLSSAELENIVTALLKNVGEVELAAR